MRNKLSDETLLLMEKAQVNNSASRLMKHDVIARDFYSCNFRKRRDLIMAENRIVSEYQDVCDECNHKVADAITVLEFCSYRPKIFCNAVHDSDVKEFMVRSSRWNWRVSELGRNDYVPARLMKGIDILREQGIEPEMIAVARPEPRRNASDVLHEELRRELRIITDIAAFLFIAIFAGIVEAVGAAARASSEKTRISRIAVREYVPKDPVLLVRIDGRWIEIGRWE